MKSKQSKATVNFSYHSLVSVKVSSERKRSIDILKIPGFHRLWSKRVSLTEISKDLTRDSESYFQRRYVVQTLQCVWNAFSKACKIGLAKALYVVYWKIKIYICTAPTFHVEHGGFRILGAHRIVRHALVLSLIVHVGSGDLQRPWKKNPIVIRSRSTFFRIDTGGKIASEIYIRVFELGIRFVRDASSP